VRVIGVDPGFHRCGFAVLEDGRAAGLAGRGGAAAGAPALAGSGVVVTVRGESLAFRLHALGLNFARLLEEWRPDAVAVEEIYFTKNVKTAIDVAQARGVVLERAGAAGVAVAEYTPTMVKSQLTGNGRADKAQVAYMVRRLVQLPPETDGKRLDDELDAIAVALCHCMRATIPEALK
jgi:crossover junction endodeoxyribonuclease RuvC